MGEQLGYVRDCCVIGDLVAGIFGVFEIFLYLIIIAMESLLR